MTRNNLIFLDTETTGLGPDDRLCQLAYTFADVEHEALFKPPLPISIDAMSVTHITNRMVEDKEAFSESRMKMDLMRLLAEGNILVAHNARFDVDMLRREDIVVKEFIDTFKVIYFLDENDEIPRYALQYLRYYFDLNIDEAPAHSALGDVRVLVALFDFLFQMMMERVGDEEKVLAQMIEVSSKPLLYRTFTFGKHIGKAVKVVADEDPGYINWLLNQKIMSRENGEDDDENWIYTLDFYIKK
ncbi:MAG: exonuclease domain-containing protein [Candidatus Moranbacteria bacterium]|nr:exonuclease domain-containing protein [Candidatus Moranbacteria bacterium]